MGSDFIDFAPERIQRALEGTGLPYPEVPYPRGLSRAEELGNLAAALRARGHPEERVRKILRDNVVAYLERALGTPGHP